VYMRCVTDRAARGLHAWHDIPKYVFASQQMSERRNALCSVSDPVAYTVNMCTHTMLTSAAAV
jgi:hypothetical protein